MPTLTAEKHELPGVPISVPEVQPTPKTSLKSSHCLWHLLYKQGNNPRKEMIFEFQGDIQRAIQRARAHCQRMNLIFIHVEAFLHDLDEDEKVYMHEG